MADINHSKRTVILVLVALGVFSLTIVFFNPLNDGSSKHRIISRSLHSSEDTINDEERDILGSQIEEFLDQRRRMIREEMTGYEYPNGKYNISATKLEDLLMENNGKPIRSVILSTFRSGSSFLGEIIGAHPANYYHFEPLTEFGYNQIRGPVQSVKAMKSIRGLFNCDYRSTENLTVFESNYGHVFNRSTRSWWKCNDFANMCYDHRFLNGYCKLFPFQSMKLVRLRLESAEELLLDENLGVRLLLLIRDPRAVMESRKHVFFNGRTPEILDSASLCADMAADFQAAVKLHKRYPSKFRVMRYEDLIADLYKNVEELSEFYGRDFHPEIREFLDTHTTSRYGGVFSTYRNTQTIPYHWKNDMSFEEVDEIQRNCETAMEQWGYLPALNDTHQKEFYPVTNYTISL